MSFLTYGQVINGQMCTCKAMCMVNCVCGCQACTNRGVVVPIEDFTNNINYTCQYEKDWTQVKNSSNIRAYKYDKPTKRLYVQFIAGTKGIYSGVTEEDFNLLEHAESKGKFISNIIKAKYKYEKYIGTIT